MGLAPEKPKVFALEKMIKLTDEGFFKLDKKYRIILRITSHGMGGRSPNVDEFCNGRTYGV